MVSQENARKQVGQVAKYVAMFAFVSVAFVALAGSSTYAQEAPQEPEPPVFVLPDACALPNPEISTPGIYINPATPTNNAALQWSWAFTAPVPEEGEETFVFDSYNYAIYNGDTLIFEGTLAADATVLNYTAPTDGTYKLYIWTVEPAQEPDPAPSPAYCGNSTIPLDATPPVVHNNGYLLNGPAATPLFAVDEEGLTYSWTVNRLGNGVEISNLTGLNPDFTFSRDGTYNFELTVSDSFGNSTVVLLPILYLAPYVPPVTGPPVIPEETIPEPIQTYTPIEEATPIAYRAAPVPSGDGKMPPEVDASIYATTADGKAAISGADKSVIGAVSAGSDGWRVLGISWYWWILIAAIIATAWLWLVRTYRSRFEPDDI